MRNAKNPAIVHTHTHTDNLDAIEVALFSVSKNKYSKLKANRTY